MNTINRSQSDPILRNDTNNTLYPGNIFRSQSDGLGYDNYQIINQARKYPIRQPIKHNNNVNNSNTLSNNNNININISINNNTATSNDETKRKDSKTNKLSNIGVNNESPHPRRKPPVRHRVDFNQNLNINDDKPLISSTLYDINNDNLNRINIDESKFTQNNNIIKNNVTINHNNTNNFIINNGSNKVNSASNSIASSNSNQRKKSRRRKRSNKNNGSNTNSNIVTTPWNINKNMDNKQKSFDEIQKEHEKQQKMLLQQKFKSNNHYDYLKTVNTSNTNYDFMNTNGNIWDNANMNSNKILGPNNPWNQTNQYSMPQQKLSNKKNTWSSKISRKSTNNSVINNTSKRVNNNSSNNSSNTRNGSSNHISNNNISNNSGNTNKNNKKQKRKKTKTKKSNGVSNNNHNSRNNNKQKNNKKSEWQHFPMEYYYLSVSNELREWLESEIKKLKPKIDCQSFANVIISMNNDDELRATVYDGLGETPITRQFVDSFLIHRKHDRQQQKYKEFTKSKQSGKKNKKSKRSRK